MLISMNWISDFVNLDGINLIELIHNLTLSTAEVEDIVEKGRDISGVVTGKIVYVQDHPTSKTLHLVEVDIGSEIIPCVCGAKNARAGIIVPFAREGAQVGELKIVKTLKGGIESAGMCCSARELGISDDHSGLLELPEDMPLGVDIKALLPIEDIVFEVDNKSLTNRPDLWCHYGFAREIAAIAGRSLKAPVLADLERHNTLQRLDIKITDNTRCNRYTGLIVENVQKKQSSMNMQIRLYYCGMRALNLLADLTNYVMLELGQPMHAFDYTRVSSVEVKTFDKEFDFTTLDGTARRIGVDTLMICNEAGPVAIAGIMGGANSDIGGETSSLFLESASFNGITTRISSSKLGLRTESSIRYEKMLDPELTVTAVKRFVQLLSEIDGGVQVASAMTDIYPNPAQKRILSIDHAFIEKYIGQSMSSDRIIGILNSLGFKVRAEGSGYHLEVPSWRATKDITIPVDLVEEITRIYGYNNLTPVSTKSFLTPVRHCVERECEYKTKQLLAERFGLHEVHSYIWNNVRQNKELGIESGSDVRIINSISSEASMIRRVMAPTLLGYINDNRFFADDFGIFEIGRTAAGLSGEGLCNEKKKLCLILASRVKSECELYFRMKEILSCISVSLKKQQPGFFVQDLSGKFNWLHPLNAAEVSLDGSQLGYMAVLHPGIREKIDRKLNIVLAELDFALFAGVSEQDIQYKEISKYPGVELDLNFLLDKDMAFERLDAHIGGFSSDILQGYTLFDVFEDEKLLGDKKSVTLRFSLGSYTSTLTSEQVAEFSREMVESCKTIQVFLR